MFRWNQTLLQKGIYKISIGFMILTVNISAGFREVLCFPFLQVRFPFIQIFNSYSFTSVSLPCQQDSGAIVNLPSSRLQRQQISSWGCKQILGDFFKKCEDLILSLISEIAEGKIIWKTIYLVLLFQFVLVFAAYDLKNLNIWPMPESVKYGAKSIFLSKEFHLKTDGSKYPDASGILKDGFTRLLDVITANNIIEFNSKVDESLLLQGINVVILSDSDELKYGIDESYKLLVHANGKQNYAEIEAATVYGALHALQTFSQLCHFYFKSRKLVISQLPWTITDKPRFSYRGLLIDTSHYQPLPMIKKLLILWLMQCLSRQTTTDNREGSTGWNSLPSAIIRQEQVQAFVFRSGRKWWTVSCFTGETGVVSVNFTLQQVKSIWHYCDILYVREVEDTYSKPMVWIGIYVTVASLFCVLAMAADLWNGFRYKKFWFPSKYFSLNAVSITVIAIAMKLPMDLNTPMGGNIDQAAKIGSLVFMCTMIANLMPSLTSIDNKGLPTNVIGFAILIITIIVNTIMEIFTGVIYYGIVPFFLVAMLLFLLIVLISVAIFVPICKQILEFKYQDIKKTSLNDHVVLDRSVIERLRQHVTRYGIMVETGSPQFVMAGNVLSSACGIICGIGLAFSIVVVMVISFDPGFLFTYESQYNWSIATISTTQLIGVLVGSIAPIVRCTTVTSKKSFATWTRKHFVIFKVEKYWTQKLYDWKESHITVLSLGRRSRSIFRKLKRIILSIWIGIQIATVVACKVICLIPIPCLIMVSCCSNYLKCVWKGMISETLTSIGDTNEDLSRYVLLLEDDMELAEKKLKQISQYVNRVIKTGEKEQDNNLLKLLKKSTGFEGVLEFDMFQVVPPLSFELPNSWSLPIATLTCIAIALPNIGSDVTDNLFKSVAEGLFYTNLVDESLNKACLCVNVQKAGMRLWDEVEDKCKWLGNTLEKNAYEGKTAKEILEWFVQKAGEILNEVYDSCHGEPIEKLPQNLIAANSMTRIAQTIMCTYNISEITKKQLFVLLSRMISDIFVACFTNLPRVITMMCHESAIEKREDSLKAAALTLGRTTEIIKEIATRVLPGMDPDKFALIDEWRLHLQSIPC